MPKLATGKAGTLQFEQGTQAPRSPKTNIHTRLIRPDGSRRNLSIRIADSAVDTNGLLLAYIALNYSTAERETLSRAERATFNLATAGWAAPFVIFPSISGELDRTVRQRVPERHQLAANRYSPDGRDITGTLCLGRPREG